MEKQRIKSIDTIRGGACLLILFSHVIATNERYGMYVNGCGKIGVWCFMIVSGFFSFLPFALSEYQSKKIDLAYVAKYYTRKWMKLYPAYLVCIVVSYIIGFIPEKDVLVRHLIFVEGYGHLWYMPVIVKFYLCFPLLVWLYQKIGKKKFQIVIVAVAVLLSIIFPFTEYIENSTSLYWYAPVFLVGILLSIIYTDRSAKMKESLIWDGCGMIVLIIVLMLTPVMRKLVFDISPTRWLQNKYLVFAVLWSVFLLCVFWSKYLGMLLGRMRILNFIGKISYEVYLIHYLIVWKLTQIMTNTFEMGCIVFVSSIVLGWLLYETTKRIVKK